MSESTENPPLKEGDNDVEVVKTPTKRTPSKRLSYLERSKKESEELIKNMGGVLDVEGGRRTRSSTRGANTSTPSTPPPVKKPRASTPRRSRVKKGDEELEESTHSLDTPLNAGNLTETPAEEDFKVEKVVQNNTSKNDTIIDNSAIDGEAEELEDSAKDVRTKETASNNTEKIKERVNDEGIEKTNITLSTLITPSNESTNSPSKIKEIVVQSCSNKITEETSTKPSISKIEYENPTILSEVKTLDSVEQMEVDSPKCKLELSLTESKENECESVVSNPPTATAETAEITAPISTTNEEKCSPEKVPLPEDNIKDSSNSCTKNNSDISALNSDFASKENSSSIAKAVDVENQSKESSCFPSDIPKGATENKIEVNNVKCSDELKSLENENLILGAEVQVLPEKQNNHQ